MTKRIISHEVFLKIQPAAIALLIGMLIVPYWTNISLVAAINFGAFFNRVSTFDVGIVITFTDEPSLRAYDQHPTHKQAVETVLRPLVAKLLVYDIESK